MDAHALLTAQGWRGHGHSLHPTSDDTGLKHHILIKREGNDGRGLGAKKDHKQEAWWMNAFDQALKGIDTSSGGMKQTVAGGTLALSKITARGSAKYTGSRGLYSCFVSGGLLKGSVGEGGLLTPPASGAGTPAAVEDEEESEEQRRARKKAKKLKKAQEANIKEKNTKKSEKQSKKEVTAKAAAKVEKKALKKAAKEALKAGETKEERRARRDARRAKKEEKRRSRNKS
ncbi:hypothetical protein BX600DRAFT_506049 [Xylariales sp. PMI_506]|nr:hypothetical protein BX600DRAFT_506049 [Xylariales sp. PMI_506]